MTTAITEKFFELLRYTLGEQTDAPLISLEEWDVLNTMATEQSLLGVFYDGLQRLSKEVQLPEETVLLWFVQNEQIVGTNRAVDAAVIKVARRFAKRGYGCCLLKGQGNALMYPRPSARTSGDIDMWVMAPVRSLIHMAKKAMEDARPMYHHVEFCPVGDIPVEVHYRPSFMNNLIHDHRLQRWFRQMADSQCNHQVDLPDGVGTVGVPTNDFNRIFQMAHISNHVIHEGIGLRQLLDYYYLLKQGFTQEERLHDEELLRRFGLYTMAQAVMYVLKEAFGMKDAELLVKADERRGRFLLKEILTAGNFGQYDPRLADSHSQLAKNVQRLRRDVRFLRYFPSECLWEPIFRWYHFFWRLFH